MTRLYAYLDGSSSQQTIKCHTADFTVRAQLQHDITFTDFIYPLNRPSIISSSVEISVIRENAQRNVQIYLAA